jgi:hypothetical protein
MEKVNLSSNNQINMTVAFSKVDVENRRVKGFATFDNVDKQGDIVLFSASEKAFRGFAGNIREMHDSHKAVGKMVEFSPTQLYKEGKIYNGISVDVYVSKGAPDTWEKVLDNTLTGFSIGGVIKDYETTFNADTNSTQRIITDYDLVELSLVDNPANQFATIASVVKSEVANESDHLEGILAKTSISNIFYCEKDNVTILEKSESHKCPVCSDSMVNIGWAESGDTDMIKSLLAKFKSKNNIDDIGGNNAMADAVEETVEAPVVEKSEAAEVSEAVDAGAPTDEVVKSETVEVPSDDSVETEVVEKSEPSVELSALNAEIAEVRKSITDLATAVTEAINGIKKSIESQVSVVEEVKAEVEKSSQTLANRIEAVEDATAVKKSSEVGPSEDGQFQKSHEEESFWGRRFVSKENF